MELDIRAGKRVLYKHNNQWEVGILTEAHNTKLTEKGLFLSIVPSEFIHMDYDDVPYLHDAEINDIFLDAFKLEEWVKHYPDYLMTKEDYLTFITQTDFDPRIETAYFSDGEYGYYPVSKYNRTWIMKQPFKYVVRSDI